jgi:apolipoprotein D and lipocalin family protein
MKMTWLSRFAVTAVLAMGFQTSAVAASELQTVSFVDVNRYLGKWYEIGSIPQIFQAGCTGVTAEYSLNDDGSVKVFNFCRLLDPEIGLPISIEGKAVPVDESNSKLTVSFFKGLTEGDYWVLELDPNYQWALVGEPSRKSLFILSRTPTLDEGIYQDLLNAAAEKHGYDVSEVSRTKQFRD